MSQDTRDHVDADSTPPALEHALVELVRRVIRKIGLELRVAAPARVVGYNPALSTATVQLELLPVEFVLGEEVPQQPIVLPEIPVRWVGGTLGHVRTGLVPGDTGHVHFSDRCLSQWLLTGAPSDPAMGRTHDLADAWFEPGLRNTTNAMLPPLVPVATEIEGSPIMLGSKAISPAVLGTELVAAFTVWTTAMATAGLAAAQPPNPDPSGAKYEAYAAAVTTATATLATSIATWLSGKVLVE